MYGEIDPRAFFELLGRVGVAPGEVFWDAGSGTGKPVLLIPDAVFDGTGDGASRGWAVLVRGQRIVSAGPLAPPDLDVRGLFGMYSSRP